jgi:hypothetical protein
MICPTGTRVEEGSEAMKSRRNKVFPSLRAHIGDWIYVVVSPLLDGNRPTEWVITRLLSQSILLPNQTEFHPSLEAFEWHRMHKLQK